MSSSRRWTYRQGLEPDTLKEEMERIWREDPIACPCHLTGWIKIGHGILFAIATKLLNFLGVEDEDIRS
jgi:hypothetical protein